MSGRRAKVLLVTGFGRFPGAPSNPTEAIVAALGGAFASRLARLGWCVERRILPADWARLPPVLARLESELAPDAVLHLGLAARRRGLTVETRAANRRRFSLDAAGRRPDAPTIDAEAPMLRSAGALPYRLVATLSRVAPTTISHDAGAYLCNLTLWHSLASRGRAAIFVHTPTPRSDAAPVGKRNLTRQRARPSAATIILASRLAVLFIARAGGKNL